MAPLVYLGCRKVLLFSLLFLLFVSVYVTTTVSSGPLPLESKGLSSTITTTSRRLLELDAQEKPFKKKTTTQSTKNQTNLIKPNKNLSLKNQTKITNDLSTKNQTKLSSNSSSKTTTLADTGLKKKLNSTFFKIKKLNSTSNSPKTPSNVPSSKKSLDLEKAITGGGANPKNKTTKATANKDKDTKQTKIKGKVDQIESEKPNRNKKPTPTQESKKSKKQATPYWMDQEEDGDLVSEFKDLPNRFQKTLIPDLERISTTSRAYITKANKEITKGFKPYVGNKYASTIATLLSCAFALIPLLLVSLLFNKIKAYFSLQKLLIFIQVYLSIYFSILCLSSLVTGLEPLRFFYSTSQSTYLCLQLLQTLAYVLYLLLLLMYLVLVFSTDCGLGSKFLGLAQTFVGFAVGLHYYMTVFHRIVLQQPPKTNWKVHGIYATCFLLICLLASADRRKKTYLEEGGEEGKKN